MPVILIELVLVFGGVLAFGVWQLRSVARDRERSARLRQAQEQPPPLAQSPQATPAPERREDGGAA